MPFYLGTTCIEKVAALQGGAAEPSLSKIVVKTPPNKLSYIIGDTVDTTGMVLSVYIGDSLIIDITDGWTVSPTTIASSTTELVFSYTLNGITKTVSQAISVSDYSTTLAENSWATIAKFAALGQASEIWNVGDLSPVVPLNGVNYQFRIIGFNHDDLASTDDKYNDATYNGGKKKAAITFEQSTLLVKADGSAYPFYAGSFSGTTGYWPTSTMKKTYIPTFIAAFPEELQNSLRLVTKWQYNCPWGSLVSSKDKVFLLSSNEMFSAGNNCTLYEYYSAGNSKKKNKPDGTAGTYYLRNPQLNSDYSHELYIVDSTGRLSYVSSGNTSGIYSALAFCI